MKGFYKTNQPDKNSFAYFKFIFTKTSMDLYDERLKYDLGLRNQIVRFYKDFLTLLRSLKCSEKEALEQYKLNSVGINSFLNFPNYNKESFDQFCLSLFEENGRVIPSTDLRILKPLLLPGFVKIYKQILSIDSVFEKSSIQLKEPISVFRGLNKWNGSEISILKPGQTFTVKGFLSTSLSPMIAIYFSTTTEDSLNIISQINFPKGYKFISLPSVQEKSYQDSVDVKGLFEEKNKFATDELELLFDRNLILKLESVKTKLLLPHLSMGKYSEQTKIKIFNFNVVGQKSKEPVVSADAILSSITEINFKIKEFV